MADAGLLGVYRENPGVKRIIDDRTIPHTHAVWNILSNHGIQTSDRAVRRLRARLAADHAAPVTPVRSNLPNSALGVSGLGTGKAEETADGVTFTNVVTEERFDPNDAKNWDHVFERFGLHPGTFEIVDDTVRMSTWQQSKRLENGDRDTINLYSYSARFRRRQDADLPADIVEQWRTALLRADIPSRAPWGGSLDATYLILLADPQLGKKGTAEAVENWKRAVRGHMTEIRLLQQAGISPVRIHVAWMGDETEGVCNNYGNQPHTVELNLTQQLELDYDLRMWTLRELLSFGLPLSASSVISNHGEWTRNGGKDVVTTRGDNASTHIARLVEKSFDSMAEYGVPQIEWTIGGGEPGVLINLSGVDCYFSHGYIEKGKGAATEIRTKNAIERQILGSTPVFGDVPLWFMAHYHHFYSQEFEGRTVFGLPALEAERSSEYMLHQYGVWSPAGAVGLLVGTNLGPRGWSNLTIH